MKDIIRLGDTTTHGGVVLEAFPQTDLNGKPIAGVGHKVSCPLCKGVFPIAEGSNTYTVSDIPVALDGMKTACGAVLIASAPKGAVIS
ncbi:PAAR domain-containing protein [Pseudomonas taetrolens]|uniref:PAAR domain-containing protein n=1 Tax=Pseudomonas taetrolens TaxID=47884 RepID=UPI0030D779FE